MAIKTIYNPLLEEGLQKVSTGDVDTEVVQTTNAAATPFPNALTIGLDSVVSFETRITGIDSGNGNVLVKLVKGAIRNLSGTVTLVDTPLYEIIATSAGAATWDITAVENTGTLEFNAIGEVGRTIEWKSVTLYSITGF